MVTLAEVAKLAGVGVGTASRALSGRGSVDELTRARVHEAAATLQYRGNAAARALRERRSMVVGLLLPDLDNEFYTAAAQVLQTEVASAGFQLIVAQTSALGDERLAWENMLRWQVDGVVHVPVDPEVPVPHDIPVVQLNRRSTDETIPAVLSDDVAGVESLTQYVIDKGHRDIGLITGGVALSTTRERVVGFQRAFDRISVTNTGAGHGLRAPRARVVHAELSIEGGMEAFSTLEADPPTVVLALNSRLVLGVLARCQQVGLSVPDDVSISAIGDPAWYAVWRPGITTFSPPLAAMGRRAGQEIVALIKNRKPRTTNPQLVRLGGELVVRNSVIQRA